MSIRQDSSSELAPCPVDFNEQALESAKEVRSPTEGKETVTRINLRRITKRGGFLSPQLQLNGGEVLILRPSKVLHDKLHHRGHRWVWPTVAVMTLMCTMIGVATTITIFKKNATADSSSKTDSSFNSSTTVSPASSQTVAPAGSPKTTNVPSTSGAYNGTDIAVLDPGNNVDHHWLFYQHHTGDLRRIAVDQQGRWGQSLSLGLSNVLNGTGIAAETIARADNTNMVSSQETKTLWRS